MPADVTEQLTPSPSSSFSVSSFAALFASLSNGGQAGPSKPKVPWYGLMQQHDAGRQLNEMAAPRHSDLGWAGGVAGCEALDVGSRAAARAV